MGVAPKLYKIDPTLEETAREYCKIKQEVKAQNETLEVLREILLSAAHEAGGKIVEGQFEICLNQKTKKSFDLKSAENVLGPETLAPFHSQTSFEELRVKILLED